MIMIFNVYQCCHWVFVGSGQVIYSLWVQVGFPQVLTLEDDLLNFLNYSSCYVIPMFT